MRRQRPHTTPFGLSLSKPPRRPSWARWARVLWASPNSLIGLLLGLGFMLAGAQLRRVDGVLEVALKPRRLARSSGRPASRWRLPFVAITFGHVVLGVRLQDLERLRPHEHTHVRQCERWGPLFLPAYLLAGAWQWMRGKPAYWDNPFEVDARRMGGRGEAAFDPERTLTNAGRAAISRDFSGPLVPSRI